jgi:hypothetical protein
LGEGGGADDDVSLSPNTPHPTLSAEEGERALFVREKPKMFFSEEKNQKTFASSAGCEIRDLAGEGGFSREGEHR